MSQLYHFTTHPNQIMSHIMVCTEQITAVSDKACVSGFSDIRKGVFPNALRASCTHVFCLSRTAAEKKKKKKGSHGMSAYLSFPFQQHSNLSKMQSFS